MKKTDVTCPDCGAGFRRIELSSHPAEKGEYCCAACGSLLEKFAGDKMIVYRLTVQPSIKGLHD